MDSEFEAHVIHTTSQDIYYKHLTGDKDLRFFEHTVLKTWEKTYYNSWESRTYGEDGKPIPNSTIYDANFKTLKGFKGFVEYVDNTLGNRVSIEKRFFKYRDNMKKFARAKNATRAWFNTSHQPSEQVKAVSRDRIDKEYK